jgi:hypothetical protein
MPSAEAVVEVGQLWGRAGGRECVRVMRVWTICDCDSPVMHAYNPAHDGGSVEAVRCKPLHGGKEWWTTLPEFLPRFERSTDA